MTASDKPTPPSPGRAHPGPSWWRRRTTAWAELVRAAGLRWSVAAGAATIVLAVFAPPVAARVVFAVPAAVLSVVDARQHRLPHTAVWDTAAATYAALTIQAAATGHWQALVRALAAGAAVGIALLAIKFAAPKAVGLGDVRYAAVAAGLPAFTGWTALGHAGLWLCAALAVTLIIGAATHRRSADGDRRAVPMGPAITAAALLATLTLPL